MTTTRKGIGLRRVGDDLARGPLLVAAIAAASAAGAVLWAESERARGERERAAIEQYAVPAAHDKAQAGDAPDLQRTGLMRAGVAGLCVGAAAFIVVLRQRRPLQAPLAVAEAACAAAGGERDREALRVDERFGAEATAWNVVVERLVSGGDSAAPAIADGLMREGGGASIAPQSAAAPGFVDVLWLGLVAIDGAARVTWLNGAAALALGARRETAAGMPLSEIVRDEAAIDALMSAAQGQRPVKASVEFPTSALAAGGADGGTLRLSARSLPTGGAIVMVEDISQQRLANQARDSFVAHATHELRTPLTNIRLYVEELMSTSEPSIETRGRCLEVISSESRRLERMVSDMLSVSEMEAGTLKLHLDDVRIDALLAELEKDFRGTAEAKGLRFECKVPPKMPSIVGDRDKLYMTLANLLGNAIKYTPESGAVTLTLRVTASEVRFEVVDTGIGISDADQERIFESFYRAKDVRVERITGTGLGLAVARQIARLHGGDISVSSVVDRGSTFILSVPARAPMSMAA